MPGIDEITPGIKKSRAEHLSEYIREKIIQGQWALGDRIDDQKLADELGVSRISIREALSKLVESRILYKQHWKGFFLTKPDWTQTESIIEIRGLLEELALKKCMEKKDSSLTGLLEDGIRQSEADLEKGDKAAFFKSDFLFHEILYEASGNEWVNHFSRQIKHFIDLLRIMDKEDQFQEVAAMSIEEHKAILEMIRIDDTGKALELMRTQIGNFKERVRIIFDNQEKAEE
jgi:DNA-binding GntR family transcriptional regulator